MSDFEVPLENPDNQCYLNTILKCLANNREIVDVTLNKFDSITGNNTNGGLLIYFAKMIIKHYGQDLVPETFEYLRRYFAEEFFQLMNQRTDHFNKVEQQDANEMFIIIINHFEEIFDNISTNSQERNIVSTIFDALVRQEIKCDFSDDCRHSNIETNRGFYLSINSDRINSIKQALDIHLQPVHFTGSNQYNCETHGLQSAVQTKTFSRLPSSLMLVLMRFMTIGDLTTKITKKIFIQQKLTLSQVIMYDGMIPFQDTNTVKYRLKSLCLHIGNDTKSGHYIAYIRRSDNIWVEHNDTTVTIELDFDRKLNSEFNKHVYFVMYELDENDEDSDEGLINTTNISMNEMSLTENRSLEKTSPWDSIDDNSSVSYKYNSSGKSEDTGISTDISNDDHILDEKIDYNDAECKKKTKKVYKRKKKTNQRKRQKKKREYLIDTRNETSQIKSQNIETPSEVTHDFENIVKNIFDEDRQYDLEKKKEKKKKEAENFRKWVRDNEHVMPKKRKYGKKYKIKINELLREKMNKRLMELRLKHEGLDFYNKIHRNHIKRRNDFTMQAEHADPDFLGTLKLFNASKQCGPVITCVSCGGLFFNRSVLKFYPYEKQKEDDTENERIKFQEKVFINKIKTGPGYYSCISCTNYIRARKIPKMINSGKLVMPVVDKSISDLNEVETRLLSPRLAFLQIKELGWDKQKGIVGNVVNVPINLDTTMKALPRMFDNSATLQIGLKRKIDYTKNIAYDEVRPDKVKKALKFLLSTELFKEEKIKINQNWIEAYKDNGTIDFIVDKADGPQKDIIKTDIGAHVNDLNVNDHNHIESSNKIETEKKTLKESKIFPNLVTNIVTSGLDSEQEIFFPFFLTQRKTNIKINLNQIDKNRITRPDELSDDIVYNYLELLEDYCLTKTHFFDPQVWRTWGLRDFSRVNKWSMYRKLNFGDYELILMPICEKISKSGEKSHWTLIVIDTKKRIIQYNNSLYNMNATAKQNEHIETLIEGIESIDNQISNKLRKYEIIHDSNIPQQQNHIDCGAYVCLYARSSMFKSELSRYNGIAVRGFRYHILKELQTSKLWSFDYEKISMQPNIVVERMIIDDDMKHKEFEKKVEFNLDIDKNLNTNTIKNIEKNIDSLKRHDFIQISKKRSLNNEEKKCIPFKKKTKKKTNFVQVKEEDRRILNTDEQFSDSIITLYYDLLSQYSDFKISCINPKFYIEWKNKKFTDFDESESSKNYDEYDIILAPIFSANRWTLIVINNINKSFILYDPVKIKNWSQRLKSIFIVFIQGLHKLNNDYGEKLSSFSRVNSDTDIPKLKNDNGQTGLYICGYMRCIIFDLDYKDFFAQDIDLFRIHMENEFENKDIFLYISSENSKDFGSLINYDLSDSSEEEDYFAANVDIYKKQGTMRADNNVENKIEQTVVYIAPGENEHPLPYLADAYAEELSFIELFGGNISSFLNDPAYSYGRLCKWMFRNQDRRFSGNIKYIFYAYKKLVAKRLRRAIDQVCKQTNLLKTLTAEEALNKKYMEQFFFSGESHLFLRTIRSSPQFWEWKKMEINSMIGQLGCPTFFMTLSPYEIEWYELLIILKDILDDEFITKKQAKSMRKEEKIKLVNRDPVTVARYFENRMNALMNFIKSKNAIFFKHPIIDYFWRVDFQYRGSPHIHMLLWCKDAPLYQTGLPKEELAENQRQCCEFIDEYITVHNPLSGYVETCFPAEAKQNDPVPIYYQKHAHKDNCRINTSEDDWKCRYGFPWPILDDTIILEPMLIEDNKKRYLKYVQIYLEIKETLVIINDEIEKDSNYYVTFNEFLKILNMHKDDLLQALRTTINKPTTFLKRDCRSIMINPYCPEIYVMNNSNMDIQFVTDPYGVAIYVAAYLMKSNAVMSTLLKQATKEIENGNYSIREKLNRLAHTFQNCSEVSAQEAVYNILSMPVSRCSRDTVYLNTFKIEDRTRVLKKDELLEKLKPNSNDVYLKEYVQHYINRPDSLNNLCYAEFAANYDYISEIAFLKLTSPMVRENKEWNSDFDDEAYIEDEYDFSETEEAKDSSNYIKLKKNGYIRKRRIEKIIRYKKFPKNTDDYYRVHLMIYNPWRNERLEVEIDNDIFTVFENNIHTIVKNKLNFMKVRPTEFDSAQIIVNDEINDYYDALFEEDAAIRIEATTALQNQGNLDIMTREELEEEHGLQTDFIDVDINTVNDHANDLIEIKVPDRMTLEEFYENIRSLNKGQKVYFLNYLRDIRNGRAFQDFLSGEGGTGKSLLISVLYEAIMRYHNTKTEDLRALLGAFTAKASYNIGGSTLHSLFSLQVRAKSKLSKQTINRLKNLYKSVRLLIIDEVSFIGINMFLTISERLMNIFGSADVFGDLSVIVVGDLNQLPPMNDYPIYFDPINRCYSQLGNKLWNRFQFYELTEIMRQKDDVEFAKILHILGTYGKEFLDENQVKLLDSRIFNFSDIPKTALILTHSNEQVKSFNESRIQNDKDGEVITNLAIDEVTIDKWTNIQKNNKLSEVKTLNFDHTNNMPNRLLFKLGMKYVITQNIDKHDGILNGIMGTLRKIVLTNVKTSKKPLVKRVYLQFDDEKIGRRTRRDKKDFYEQDGISEYDANLWTLFTYTENKIMTSPSSKDFIKRKQFKLVEGEAMTVHKSQGQTYNQIAVNFESMTKQALTYVALSRVTKLSGLYLFGPHLRSVFTEKNYNMSKQDLDMKKEKIECQSKQQELRRLRLTCYKNNYFEFLNENYVNGDLTIIYHNIRSLSANKKNIESDHGMNKADILLFVECHTNLNRSNDDIQLKGYRRILLTGSKKKNSSVGQACFVKSDKNIDFVLIATNTDAGDEYFDNNILEMSCFIYKNKSEKILVFLVYKHNKLNKKNFNEQFFDFYHEVVDAYPDCDRIYVIGDFNFDFNNERNYLKEFTTRADLISLLSECPTYKIFKNDQIYLSQIDWCFTNCPYKNSHKIQDYESWYSDHSAIYLEIIMQDNNH